MQPEVRVSYSKNQSVSGWAGLVVLVSALTTMGVSEEVCCDTRREEDPRDPEREINLARCGLDGRCNRDWLGWRNRVILSRIQFLLDWPGMLLETTDQERETQRAARGRRAQQASHTHTPHTTGQAPAGRGQQPRARERAWGTAPTLQSRACDAAKLRRCDPGPGQTCNSARVHPIPWASPSHPKTRLDQ